MAAQNFKVKNGLTVGTHDIIDSSGNIIAPGNITVSGTLSQTGGATYATETYVDTAVSNVQVDLTGYATETYVDTAVLGKVDAASLATVATSGLYSDLTGTPTIPADIADLTDTGGLLTHFSGDYNDLTNAPSIPVNTSDLTNDSGFITSSSLTGLATETYVDTAIANLVDTAPTALDTLNELAAALGDDANFATTITNSLSAKADTSSLSTVATSGDYTDLINTPTIPSSLTDLGITDGTSGQVLSTDGAGNFTFADAASGVTVSGTAPTSPSEGDMWFDNVTTGQLYTYVGTTWLSTAGLTTLEYSSVGDLSDVDITTVAPTDGQALVWDNANSKFIPGNAGVSSYNDLTDLPTIPANTSDLINDSGFITSSSLTGLATETYVGTAIANLVDAAPAALDTLNELAAALGDDANFATTVTNSIAAKQDTLVSGTNIKTINGESLLGSTDITITSAVQLVFNETYVAAEGDTTFSITYDSIIGVFVNGIKLRPAEYDATSGTNIVLNEALTEGDTVDAIGYLVNTDDYTAPILPPTFLWGGDRGLFGGGYNDVDGLYYNTIEYVTITTPGNATNFGSLSVPKFGVAACSNGTRGLFGGGVGSIQFSSMEYITIATPGNATYFGSLTSARYHPSACSDGTRGVFGGGYNTDNSNVIDYVTIASTSNAVDFGDLILARNNSGACSDATRGLFGGGSPTTATIEYVTIATPGNATSFGNLTVSRSAVKACSNVTRGLFGGGYSTTYSNTIDYVTIATTGNATDFGDLTVSRYNLTACSNATRGLFAGGSNGVSTNVIDYVTIATAGNATDFGDLTTVKSYVAATSGN